MTIIIPINISFVEWANQLRNSFPNENISIVKNENDFFNFSAMLQSNRCFEGKIIPDVAGHTDWQQWASEFMQSIGA